MVNWTALRWTLSSTSMSLMDSGAQNRIQPSWSGPSSDEQRGSVPSLDLLAMLCLMKPVLPSAFLAARACCWLMVNLVSTSTPRSSSSEVGGHCYVGLLLPEADFSSLNCMRFLSLTTSPSCPCPSAISMPCVTSSLSAGLRPCMGDFVSCLPWLCSAGKAGGCMQGDKSLGDQLRPGDG